MKMDVERLKGQIERYEKDLEITNWYIKFMQDGRDIKQILQDQENALARIEELESTLQGMTEELEGQISEL